MDTVEVSIDDIINDKGVLNKEDKLEDNPDKFNSVINFQNFLLHVLRVQTAEDSVALDDKRLIDIFEKQIKGTEEDRIAFVKGFIFNLLKCKFLFDKYIIKREFTANTDRWSLKCLKWYNSGKVKNGVKYVNTFGEEQSDSFDSNNRQVLMLLSMFHISIPSMPYKYWLNAALNYLFNQFEIDSKDYINYLEHIAKSFVFDRYLAIEPLDYFPMIYENLKPIHRNLDQLDFGKLLYGNISNNLVFNFVDYLLWLQLKNIEIDKRVKSFEFTFRSSVEHYYPQNPINKDVKIIEKPFLHSFGNLCLISHEKNSRLNNYSPSAKKDHYDDAATLDSLKQFLMIKESTWFIKEIEAHNKYIVDLLCKNLNSNFEPNSEISLAKSWFREWQIKDRVLLARNLLCFGDCAKHINGNKYNIFDFDFIKEHEAFKKFEEYVNERTPKHPNDVINYFLNSNTELQNDWRYLFIKYPCVLEYCKEGNFTWEDNGKLIYLLESEKRTSYKAKEIYTSIIQNYFFEKFKFKANCNRDCLFFNIGYSHEGYFITENYNEASLQLIIWNNNGFSLEHSIETKVNGNSKAVKLLYDSKWEKNYDGNFVRMGKSKIITLGDDYEINISNAIQATIKILKNGLRIKL